MEREGDDACRVEVLRSIDSLPRSIWRELAPSDDPMWSRAVFEAMESGSIGPDGYAYLVVRRGHRTEAVLPLCLFRNLRLDDVVGPRERRLLAPVRKTAPGLLRVPMLFCGNFLGQGHVLTAGPLTEEVSRVLVDAVLRFARSERLGTVVFKDFAPAGLAPLRTALSAAGFFPAPSLPDTELTLSEATFDAYVEQLPAKPRRNARSNLRKFAAWPGPQAHSEPAGHPGRPAHPGLRMETVEDFRPLVPEMLGLYQQVMDRADQRLDVLDADFLTALAADPGPDRRLVACFDGERLVAFLLCLFRGTGATGARIGLDYALAHDARLYHNVHYAAIRLALDAGCRHIRFAQTAYTPKGELGCRLVKQSYAITHLRPLPRALLRRLLPPALAAARAQALGPHPPAAAEPPSDAVTAAADTDQEGAPSPCPE
ncbi:GNAT family N-acetyltransferase [Streptomyces tsukubensis]|uniref:GNAT family N-acetyltransferase n=1 Tax=Streptomyces tsukubensis TaxID=83656 RepID=A0A1V4A016_9ACTN|nr:GNAT family N-acetyltransferase [Streptomyces tsukubensis]OON71589.1 GNAT family N-acetyltransferase [Streptomyces tsukubensis]QFR93235.1 GNAT family N-acetyltransferase [Streptomyces tsukubensis]